MWLWITCSFTMSSLMTWGHTQLAISPMQSQISWRCSIANPPPPPPPTNARLNFYLPIKCKPLCFLQSTQGIIDTRNVVGIFLVDIIIRQKSMPNSRNGVGIHYDVAGIYAKSNFLFSLTQWEKPKARLHTLLPTTDDQLATLCQQTCLTYLQTV